jgi:hypothetical protein
MSKPGKKLILAAKEGAEIARLTAERDRLRAALQEIANMPEFWREDGDAHALRAKEWARRALEWK